MRENREDTRLVAYVVGDMPPRERAAVEAELAGSEAMRVEVEAIRATVAALQGALASEAQASLTPEQQAAVESEARRERSGGWGWILARPVLTAISATATLAAAVALWHLVPEVAPTQDAEPSRPSQVAHRATPVATPRPTPAPPETPVPAAAPEQAQAADAGLVLVPDTPTPTDVRVAGSLRGRVRDESGAVVPGAQVTLRNEESGSSRTTVSNALGGYFFPAVPPGRYELTVDLTGFMTSRTADLSIHARDAMSADVNLSLGSISETITVTGTVPEIQASSGARESSIAQEQPQSISINGRRVGELMKIAPGVTSSQGLTVGGPQKPKKATGKGNESDSSAVDGVRAQDRPFNTESYDHIEDNPFILVAQDPRSTFSIDVDTASYSNVRRFLDGGHLPLKDAVRIEELINYFPHADAPPNKGQQPFAVHLEAATCPWAEGHILARIGLKGREVSKAQRPPANLVFLLDVSGSMDEPNKLPLVQDAMRMLAGELRPDDRVAIVVYAGAAGLVLPSTLASNQASILAALDQLSAGGSTQGSAGIRLAYQTAREHFVQKGINRVILATDGDFNVGVTNQGDLVRLIEDEAKSGIFLTTLGFGMGNIKDSTLEKLADRGNGNYAYIDTRREARKVLVEQVSGTLVTIAKDVKIQLELNPVAVKAFRLIGYENRVLAHQDFDDDTKDAGEIGAGHSVTALYELVPAGDSIVVPGVDPLKYQEPPRPKAGAPKDELLTVKLRYKQPSGERSRLLEVALKGRVAEFADASADLRFDAAVASFGMLLRDSPFKGTASYPRALEWARASLGTDPGGYRKEFLGLVEKALELTSGE